MKQWKGKWIIAVAALHMLVAFVLFGAQLQQIMDQGIIGASNSIETKLAAWFFLFGILLIVVGQLFISIEKAGAQVPTSAALTLLILTVLGVALMPVSGFWLVFPPVIALFINKNPYQP